MQSFFYVLIKDIVMYILFLLIVKTDLLHVSPNILNICVQICNLG